MKKVDKFITFFWTFYFCFISVAFGEEIIQHQEMNFSTCLTVIENSEKKLSLVADITKKEENYTQAEFVLVDGSLIIRCDGDKGTLTVVSE
tara:strand:- start:37 stop:309 length:273 start_codon:yes stop_codon:yes gene_type:complete